MENLVNFEQFLSTNTTVNSDEVQQLQQPSLTFTNCNSGIPLTAPSMNFMSSMLQHASHYSSASDPLKLCQSQYTIFTPEEPKISNDDEHIVREKSSSQSPIQLRTQQNRRKPRVLFTQAQVKKTSFIL
uniref:Uncharacterized protein n=1 Tax=Panagrolaimus sp. ES5 TaxID=591445 RepID=A0AC34GTA0_9BILA